MIPEGRYRARGCEAALAHTSKGDPQVAVDLVITEEESDHCGQHRTWYGSFTDKSTERTLQSLRFLGWDNDDLSQLTGIDQNEVWVTITHEEDLEGVLRDRAAFINNSPGLGVKSPMDEGAAKAFAQRMMGNVLAHKQKSGSSPNEAAKPGAASGKAAAANVAKRTPPKKPSTQQSDFAPDQAVEDEPF